MIMIKTHEAPVLPEAWRARSWLRCGLQMAGCFASKRWYGWYGFLDFYTTAYPPKKKTKLNPMLGLKLENVWVMNQPFPFPVPCSLLQGDGFKTIFDLMKWAADSANGFYRALHSHGVWIPRDEAEKICILGWGVTDPWFAFANLYFILVYGTV